MATIDRRAVVVLVDQSFSATRFRARLDAESRNGSFFLVLGVDDDLEVTMDMARVWLAALLDRQLPMHRLVVASRTPRTLHLVQALALAAQFRGSSRRVESAASLEVAASGGEELVCPA